jgi:hypothetical protein
MNSKSICCYCKSFLVTPAPKSGKPCILNLRWVSDFQGALTVLVLMEYLELFQELEQVVLQPGMPDKHIWQRLSPTGNFSSKSAYTAMFQGAISFQLAERVLHLVSGAQCWTAVKLAMRGMDCPEQCPLCDQDSETINHLLTSCVASTGEATL